MWFEDMSNMKDSSLIVEEWRDIWSTKMEFMFAALAYLFATTNLLNLPRLILENGGPAFLVAYGASLLVVVLPILLLELAIGQLTGRGPVQSFYNICPVFKGVGISQILFSILIMATMTRLLASVGFHIYHLFWTLTEDRPGIPWLHCKNFPEFHFGDCIDTTQRLTANSSHYMDQSKAMIGFSEDSAMAQFMDVLDSSSDRIDQIGQMQWHWLIGQAIVWLLVFSAICFGVRWLGKVMLLTFFVPLALLLVLCGRALFLEAALEQFELFFINSLDWERLKDIWLWKAAVEQSLIASGLGFGAFITMGSYNKRSNNLVQDAFLLILGHALLSIVQICFVICLAGHVSHRIGLSPGELLAQGEAQFHELLVLLAYVPQTKLFSAFFLFMIGFAILNVFYLLALSILATLEDALGEKWSSCCPRFALALFVCALGMGSSVFFATQAGKHGYELAGGFLHYATLSAILACEIVAVAWAFGAHQLGLELRAMLHSTCCWCFGHFILFLNFLLPAVPIAIAVANLLGYSFGNYSEEVRAWEWSELVGIGIAVFPLLPIPLWAFYAIAQSCSRRKRISYCKRISLAFRSPLRCELMKMSMSSSAVTQHRSTTMAADHRPLLAQSNRASPGAGYMLLPQAPLAQPESDDVMPNSARAPRAAAVASHQQQHQRMSTSTSTIRADSAGTTEHQQQGAFV